MHGGLNPDGLTFLIVFLFKVFSFANYYMNLIFLIRGHPSLILFSLNFFVAQSRLKPLIFSGEAMAK